MRLDIDLTFSRTEPEVAGKTPVPLQGSVTASGKHIVVTIDSEDPVLV